MKIYLIRHGETTGDLEDRYGGWYDDSLTEKGREQLHATAEELVGKEVEVIFSSTLKRAKESAEIINEQLQVEIEFLDGLRERNYGVLGGLKKLEALERYPEAVEAHKDPANTDPGGESQADFIARVEAAFDNIKSCGLHDVIILGHGGSLKVVLKKLGEPIPDKIGDGGIIEVECN